MRIRGAGALAAVVAVAFTVGLWAPWAADAQTSLVRLSAQFKRWDQTLSFTDAPIPGITVYQKSVFVPSGMNTLYVTVSATGATHGGNVLNMACFLDGVECNPGTTAALEVPGWIALQAHNPERPVNSIFCCGDPLAFIEADDLHSNSLHYTWCTPVTAGTTHTVSIKMASSDFGADDDTVFLEGIHFFIDGNTPGTGSQCVQSDFEGGEQPI
jgi:hypothetical protein